jgi:hypothetical protein
MFHILDVKLNNATNILRTTQVQIEDKWHSTANTRMQIVSLGIKRLWVTEYKTESLIILRDLIYVQLSGFMYSLL